MKSFFYLFIIFTIFFSSQTVFAIIAVSPSVDCVLTAFLKVGSRGAEVRCLQRKVGVVADGIFGPITAAAVMVFQSNHGLAADGMVGPLSRAAFSRVAANRNSVVVPTPLTPPTALTPPTPITTPIIIPETSQASGGKKPESLKNPQQNLETYIASVKKALIKRGDSSDTISFIEEKLRRDAMENPNALQQFFDTQREIYKRTISKNIFKAPVLMFLKKAVSSVDGIFSIQKASASSGAPFGGFIIFVASEICTCNQMIGQLFVELPSAPVGISNMTLNYVKGAQAFLNYNLPEEDTASLGFYTPGVLSCLIRVHKVCVPLPAAGQITPVVGTSLE